MPKGKRFAQCLVEIDLGLNHRISKGGTVNQCSRDGGTEGASRSMGVRRGNRRLRAPTTRYVSISKKILTCQLRQTATFDQHSLGAAFK